MNAILQAYLDSLNSRPAITVAAMSSADGAELVRRALTMAVVDARDRQREALLALVGSFVAYGVLSEDDLDSILRALLQRVSDMRLDRPDAADVLASCAARLVLDGAISEDRLTRWNNTEGATAVATCCIAALHDPAPTPLQQTRAILRDVVGRYMSPDGIGSIAEVEAALDALAAPHEHHEFTVKVAQRVVDMGTPVALAAGSYLLRSLLRSNILSQCALHDGMSRAFHIVYDMLHDHPHAFALLAALAATLVTNGSLPRNFLEAAADAELERCSNVAVHALTLLDSDAVPPLPLSVDELQTAAPAIADRFVAAMQKAAGPLPQQQLVRDVTELGMTAGHALIVRHIATDAAVIDAASAVRGLEALYASGSIGEASLLAGFVWALEAFESGAGGAASRPTAPVHAAALLSAARSAGLVDVAPLRQGGSGLYLRGRGLRFTCECRAWRCNDLEYLAAVVSGLT